MLKGPQQSRHVETENLVVNCHHISGSSPVACHEARSPWHFSAPPCLPTKGKGVVHMHRFPFSKDLEVNRTNRGIAGEPENLVTKTVTDLVPTFHNLVRLGSWETSVAVTPKSTPHQRPAAIEVLAFHVA